MLYLRAIFPRLALLLLLLPAQTWANSGGKTGSTAGCSCHSGGTTPDVVIEAPAKVKPGTKALIKLLVTHKSTSQVAGGFNLKASAGTLSVSTTDTGVKVSGGEVTHTATKSGVSGVTTFTFEWTAPSSFTSITLSGAGNSVNKNGGTSGDMWKTASVTIQADTTCADADNDGATDSSCGGTDCNDSNPAINPSATEVCDTVDNDCDSQIDENVKTTYYLDADGDSFGTSSTSTQACSKPAGYATQAGDCNDSAAAINPSATEVCDTVDNDCDSQIDENVKTTYYTDADGDGYGTSSTTQACSKPTGYASQAGDCNDSSAAANPGMSEICDSLDNDCDSQIDEGVKTTYYLDADGDGYGTSSTQACSKPTGYASQAGDCNDSSAASNPGATETCDSLDNDCDTQIDEGVKTTYYLDADGDGYGTSSTTQACSQPAGYASQTGDCNDSSAASNPGATETCDSLDNDCDTQIDEGVKTTYYTDADGDGYGTSSTTQACSKPTGYASQAGDCNDSSAAANPGATETCDSLDNDCDAQIDEGVKTTYYLDADGDGYGTSSTTQACSQPAGYATQTGDCNDSSAAANPGQTELSSQCGDGVDQDCNGQDLSCNTQDLDQDGFTPNQGDCNDANASVNPAAPDVCDDGIDQDCKNGDLDCDTLDQDADGFTPLQGDCNDSDDEISPDGVEIPYDGIDQDCNDEDLTDVDNDGFDSTEVSGGTDCNDEDRDAYPGAEEACEDGIDQDCDGTDASCPTPTPIPSTPTPIPSTPTPEPETPTLEPETPSLEPETPTLEPETPTSAPETPTSAPETPTTAPETPTEAPSATPTGDDDAASCSCNTREPAPRGIVSLFGLALLAGLPLLRRRRR